MAQNSSNGILIGKGNAGHLRQGLYRPQTRHIGFELAPLDQMLGIEQPGQAAHDQVKLAQAVGELLLQAVGGRLMNRPLKIRLMGMKPVPPHGRDGRPRQQDGDKPLPSPTRQAAGPRKA